MTLTSQTNSILRIGNIIIYFFQCGRNFVQTALSTISLKFKINIINVQNKSDFLLQRFLQKSNVSELGFQQK